MASALSLIEYSMSLLSLIVIVVVIAASPCVHNYPNSTIGYLVNNINIDSSIYYLGHKTSTNECEHSCINFNYLCNTSSNNIFYNYNDINTWTFNNTECSITALITDRDLGSTALLTQDLISNEYIIELQLSILSRYEGGVIFKTKNQLDNYRDYFFSADAGLDRTITGLDQYDENPTFIHIDTNDLSTAIDFNKKYNLSVHVINNIFTTYFNGEQMYTNTDKKQDWIDESLWTQSYAGVYGWDSHVIFHSFNIEFPNNNDNEDTKWCSAYMYDKDSGDCYAYYGDNYTIIESTVSVQTGSDSAVVYPSTACAPLPSNDPTTFPSNDPTAFPSNYPTEFPSIVLTASSLETPVPSRSHTTMTLMSTESMDPSVDRISTVVTVAIPGISETNKFENEGEVVEVTVTETETEDEDEGVSNKKHGNKNVFIYIAVGIGAAVAIIIISFCLYKYIGQKRSGKQQRMVVHEMEKQKHVEQSIDNNREDINTTIGKPQRIFEMEMQKHVEQTHSNMINNAEMKHGENTTVNDNEDVVLGEGEENHETKGNGVSIGDDEFIVIGDEEMGPTIS